MTNRETIYAALFAKLAATSGLITSSRRLVHWSDVAPADQPALYMAQKTETVERKQGMPGRWRLAVDVYLYVNTGNDLNATPTTIINPLIDAIEAALAPTGGITQTLGGLVSHCFISGTIQTDEGILGGQGLAIIPIEILTAP